MNKASLNIFEVKIRPENIYDHDYIAQMIRTTAGVDILERGKDVNSKRKDIATTPVVKGQVMPEVLSPLPWMASALQKSSVGCYKSFLLLIFSLNEYCENKIFALLVRGD